MSRPWGRGALLDLFLLIGSLSLTALVHPASGASSPKAENLSQKQLIDQEVQYNRASVEKTMGEIHQLMFKERFTPEQDTEITKMMIRLGTMMQEMSGPERDQLTPRHEQELQQIRHRLEILKQSLQPDK